MKTAIAITLYMFCAFQIQNATFVNNKLNAIVNPKVPYDLAKFRSLLDQCNLQAPKSYPAAAKPGDYDGSSTPHFYVTDDLYLTLQVTKNTSTGANRAELRHRIEWSNTEPGVKSINARLRFDVPSNVKQFTFMQIHSKSFGNYTKGPPLGLSWHKERKGKPDWLWANIRKGLDPKNNLYISLQKRPEGFFDIEVKVLDSKLTILINGVPMKGYNERDISVLDPLTRNYFKAGSYVNYGTGPAVVDFDQLEFKVEGKIFP